MSPYGNLAGDKSENNSFKMAWGKVKGKDANISEIIRLYSALGIVHLYLCSRLGKKTNQCNTEIVYLLSAFIGSKLVQSVVLHRNSLPCPSLLFGSFTLDSRNISELWEIKLKDTWSP